MRLTRAQLREAAIIAGLGLIAPAAMVVTDLLIGRDSPFMPAIISSIFTAAWIVLASRLGGASQPVDPRRRRIWLLCNVAACAVLAVLGAITAEWIHEVSPPATQH
jgi:hypothetical protein